MRTASKLALALLLLLLMTARLALGEGEAQERAPAGSAASADVSGGAATAVLLGAGAYTGLRMHLKNQKAKREADTPGYVYFENHTKNGTLTDAERLQSEREREF